MRYGDIIPVGHSFATVLADMDFETRSDAGYVWTPAERKWRALPGSSKRGLPAVGARVYVEHYSFSPLLLAYDLKDGDGPKQWEIGESFDVLAPLFDHVRAGKLIEAHRSAFEWFVWQYYCVPVWGWPALDIEQLRCSAAKSRAAGYPGALVNAGAVLNIPNQKMAAGKALIKLFTEPRNPTKADPRTHIHLPDAPPERLQFKAYNVGDIVSESQVSERVPDLSPAMLREWFLDQKINDRGMATDSKAIEDCIAIVEQAYEKFGEEIRGLTATAENPGGIEASELQQLKGWLETWGVNLPDMTEDTINDAVARLTPAGYSPALRSLQIRQMIGSASVKKLYALRAQTARAGRVYDMYQFHATHHGRTGGYGVQPANLVKGDWHTPEEVERALAVLATRNLAAVEAAYPNLGPLDVVNNVLRSLFVAAPGSVLVSSDYSAIEDVVLAALAGEEWVLEVHRTHGMIYEAQIALMTGRPFQEFIDHRVGTGGAATYGPDGRLIKIKGGKHHPLRQQGKLAKLSGGYASWIGGWKKFGADEYYDTDADIKRAILSYRDSVPNTVEMWGGQTRDKFRYNERPELYGLEGCAISAVQNPGVCYRYRLIGFQVADDTLYMQLPSGRLIQYHAPRLEKATRQYSSPWELELSYEGWNTNPDKGPPAWLRMDLYGGVLTQNATGGTARDIMMHGMLNLDAAGYPIVMHTYDEAVAEVSEADVINRGLSVQDFESLLNDLPDYAKGWPIFARGGWMGPRYGKWD